MGGAPIPEDPLLTAHRELEEEVGLRAQSMQEIMRLFISKSSTDEAGVVYIARDLSPGKVHLEDTEADLEVLRLPFLDAVQWVMDGKITDVISCAGLLKAAVLLHAS
jgi:8-oxo-dGTP pyrophosphatase MutT (NUDIX family)